MSIFRLLFFFLFSASLFAQSAELANSFFRKGEYEKAILLYEPLLESNPIRQDYFKSLLTCYQQLEKYTYALFERGTQMAAERGLILVDTKYEFGKRDGEIFLIDEI